MTEPKRSLHANEPKANPPKVHTGTDLRQARHALGLTLTNVARGLNTNTSRISRLEREEHRNNQLATEYKTWLNQQAA